METWLERVLPPRFVWLDEIFADDRVRPKGNLRNFERVVREFARANRVDVLAYRTKNERLRGRTQNLFGDRCEVYTRTDELRVGELLEDDRVPDLRDFVVVRGLA